MLPGRLKIGALKAEKAAQRRKKAENAAGGIENRQIGRSKTMIGIEGIENAIILYQNYYEKVSKALKELKNKVPDGAKLYAAKHGETFQYYVRWNGTNRGREYICKEKIEEAKILAQVEYFEKLTVKLQNDIKCLEKLKETWSGNPFNWVEDNMSRAKYALVNPIYYNDSRYTQKWKDQIYEKKQFKENSPDFFTRRGLRVRSKSEVIIADMLDEMQIPFIYEKPLKLGIWTIHPDFTLLDINNRCEVYWEHFGMMDDADYRNNAFLKIRKYEENGFYQHDRLIWTFETGKQPLNTKVLRKMIMQLAKKLGYKIL